MKKSIKVLSKLNFCYKHKSYQEVVDIINDELPIKLVHNQDLIDRVSEKYPLLTKAEIAVIVKGTFQTIRDVIISNKILNINNFLCHSKIYFLRRKSDKNIFNFYFSIITPNGLKK